MDEEYFVVPAPVQPDPVVPRVPVEELDLAPLLREPKPGRGWARGLSVLGYVMFAAGVLTIAALPVLGVVAVFRFLDSLPW